MVAHRHTLPPLSAFHPLLATAADTGDFAAPEHKEFDVLGWGQAMVDFSAHASSEYLEELGVQSGERRLVACFGGGFVCMWPAFTHINGSVPLPKVCMTP